MIEPRRPEYRPGGGFKDWGKGGKSYPDKERVAAELAALAHQIVRADAEASRLRQARLRAWQDARAAGLSWRAIAAASGGMDHAQIAKTVNGLREGTD